MKMTEDEIDVVNTVIQGVNKLGLSKGQALLDAEYLHGVRLDWLTEKIEEAGWFYSGTLKRYVTIPED